MQTVTLIFLKAGSAESVEAEVGASLLQVAQDHGLDVEGACEGNMACATCHMVFQPRDYDTLPDASLPEEEMLDLAIGLTATSRLGCQIIVTPQMQGWTIRLADDTGSVLGL